jgi:hypothetical protein
VLPAPGSVGLGRGIRRSFGFVSAGSAASHCCDLRFNESCRLCNGVLATLSAFSSLSAFSALTLTGRSRLGRFSFGVRSRGVRLSESSRL